MTGTPPVEEESIYANRAVLWDRAITPAIDDQRAPATYFFYRFLVLCFGPELSVLRLGNVVLGTLFLVVFFHWCRRIVPRKTALAAALLAAVHPELVFYSASLWSESLYLLVVYTAFLMFWRVQESSSWPRTILLGALVGVTALAREIGVLLAPIVFLGLLVRTRSAAARRTAQAGLFLVAFALTILPWSIEMSRRSDRTVLISGMNERRLYVGNVPLPGIDPRGELAPRHGAGLKSYWSLSKDPAERRELARRAAFAAIKERLPLWPLEKVRDELPKFFSPNSFPAARLFAHPEDGGWAGKWAYRFTNEGLDRRAVGLTLGLLVVGFHVATTLFGAAGLTLLPLGRAIGISLLAFAAAHVLPTLAATACSRYRLPLTPIFILGAAALLFNGMSLWKAASMRRRLLAVAMAILVIAILIARARFVLPAQYG